MCNLGNNALRKSLHIRYYPECTVLLIRVKRATIFGGFLL